MRAPDDVICAAVGRGRGRRRGVRTPFAVGSVFLLAVTLAACSSGPKSAPSALATPSNSIAPTPNYPNSCAPVGADTSSTCLRLTLAAIDTARAGEGLGPMVLPADFAQLTRARAALRRHRPRARRPGTRAVRRPVRRARCEGAGGCRQGPAAAPARPRLRRGRRRMDRCRRQRARRRLTSGCTTTVPTAACRAARTPRRRAAGPTARSSSTVSGTRHLVMGAAFDPTGDTSPGDRGGSSLAATLAVAVTRPAAYVYTWSRRSAAMSAGTLQPLRAIPAVRVRHRRSRDPAHNVPPVPDYTRVCAGSGVDDSAGLHRLPSSTPSTTPTRSKASGPWCSRPGFAQLSVPEQLFVAVNLERVDRGLPAFGGLDDGARRQRAAGRGRRQRPTRPGTGLRPRRRRVGRRLVQRARRRLRLDVRRRLRQRQPRLPAPRGRRLLGPPQGHPRRLRLGPNLVMGAAIDTHGRHPQRRRRRARPWRSRSPWPARPCTTLHLQLGAGGGCRRVAAGSVGLSRRDP